MQIPKEESEIVEFKESTSLLKESGKSIVAFANTKGGKLYFGIKDNGEIVKNNNFNDSTLKQLANHFQQAIDPNVYYSMNIIPLDKTAIIEIEIEKSTKPIHTCNEILYIRVGTTDQKCDKYELQDRLLKYSGYYNDWSKLACKDATTNNLDNNAIDYFRNNIIKKYLPKEDYQKYNTLSNTDLLQEFGLIYKKNNELKITNSCMLLFGEKNIALRLIGNHCRIQYRYSHTGDFSDYTQGGVAPDRSDWRPPFINKFEQIRNKIESHNHYLAESDLFRNKQIKQYDLLTIRELMMNSFVHRDWTHDGFIQIDQTANSLQFENPGKYKFKDLLELVQFPTQSKFYRNSHLADFMFQCGLVDQEASGIKRKIIEKQIERGLPLPKYSIIKNWTKVLITSKVVNLEFAKLMLQKTDINVVGLIFLDRIIEGKNKINLDISKEEAEKLKEQGFIEIIGGRYKKAYLSKQISKKITKTGIYTKTRGLNKERKIQLILSHIENFKQIKLSDLNDLFTDLTLDQKKNLFRYMKNKNLIRLIKPNNKRTDWYYIKSDTN